MSFFEFPFETFCKLELQNKLCGNSTFIVFGHTDEIMKILKEVWVGRESVEANY
jgi:hypothetical protein